MISRLTIRQQVARILETEIRSQYSAGDRLPGERDLAKRFAVSIATLREALNGLADRGFVQRRQGIGTIVCATRATDSDLPVGILVESDITHPNTSPYYINQAVALKRSLEAKGHRAKLLLGELKPWQIVESPTCTELIHDYEARSLKALIVLSWTCPNWRLKFENAGIPVIRIGSDCPRGVKVGDNNAFISSAMADLLHADRRRLALISWEGHYQEKSRESSESFRLHLKEAGLPVHNEWVSVSANPSNSGAGWEAFREVWLSRKEKPNGLIVNDDVLLRGVLVALHELRVSVPEQLLIISKTSLETLDTGTTPVILYGQTVESICQATLPLLEEVLQNPHSNPRLITLNDTPRHNSRSHKRSIQDSAKTFKTKGQITSSEHHEKSSIPK